MQMVSDRMEITNPGGLYGRLTIDQLGNVQPDTRNPVLVTAMETLGETENRYSGIPTIKYAMEKHALPAPLFKDSRGEFSVTLYNTTAKTEPHANMQQDTYKSNIIDEKGLIEFCRSEKSRAEIIEFLNIPSAQYALKRYLEPLIETGAIRMTLPDKPRSPKQKFISAFELEDV